MDERTSELQAVIDRFLIGKTSVRILEAGCGSASYVDFPKDAHIVGIDISEKQLRRNSLLHERILGDIEDHEYEPSEFDMILCWDVLEHLPHPERAIAHLVRSLKEDGLMILAFPNVLSLKGLVTKFTPHFVHKLAYKMIYKEQDAGKEDNAPFRTYLRFSIAPKAIIRTAERLGLEVEYHYSDDVSSFLQQRYPLSGIVYRGVAGLLSLTSRGTIGDSDHILVLRAGPHL